MSDRTTRSQLANESGSAARTVSHGRGGAGNLGKESKISELPNLDTPTIKADKYTTGRGGSGNIATNDPSHPEVARAAQDVGAVKPSEQTGKVHIGRGGAANTAAPGEEKRDGKGVVTQLLEKVGIKK